VNDAAEPKPGVYRHFKGNLYQVLAVATHSETEARVVVYHPLERPDSLWVRPVSMFVETVEHDGVVAPRFALQSD
jgi:hypothetical protein